MTVLLWPRTPLRDCQVRSILAYLLRHPGFGGQAGTKVLALRIPTLKLTQIGGYRIGLAPPFLNCEKRPPGKLQFHQFLRSFRILAFVINAAAVAVTKKRRHEFSHDEALSVV